MYTPGDSDIRLAICVGVIVLACKAFDRCYGKEAKIADPPEGFEFGLGQPVYVKAHYDSTWKGVVVGHNKVRDEYAVRGRFFTETAHKWNVIRRHA